MRFWRRFLIFLLTVGLIVLSICLVLIDTLGSGIKINQLVKKAGLYQAVKNSFLSQFDKSVDLPPEIDKTRLKTSIDKSISTADIEKTFEPALVDLVTWLNSTKDIADLKLVIDLGQLKDQLEEGVGQDFNPAEKDVIMFGLTSQVSDRVVIVFDKSTSGNNAMSADSVKQIRNLYIAVKNIFWALIIINATILVLLGLMNIRRGRYMLQKPAWGFFNAGVSILVMAFLLPFFLPATTSDQANVNQLSTSIFRVVLVELRFWGFVWMVVWLILTIFSLALKKPDKRHKR